MHVNKTNFHMKGFALGLALKERRNATRKSPIITPPSTESATDLFPSLSWLYCVVIPCNIVETKSETRRDTKLDHSRAAHFSVC